MTFTANGKPILAAQITETLSGAWTAQVVVDSAEDLGNSVTLELGSVTATFRSTKVRGAVEHGRWIALLVGGAGGLSRDVQARYYNAVPTKTVLAGLMTDAGETLAGTVARSVLDRALPVWLRPDGPPVTALDDLAAELGVSWRVLRDGRVWLGAETWPNVSMPHVEVSRGPSTGTLTVAPAEAPLVRPGTTFSGLRASHVVTTLSGGKLRQKVWGFETRGDRIKKALGELIRQLLGNQIDYSKAWPAEVVSQAGDGTLEVVPDDQRIRGLGLKRVPIRHGLPGSKVKVPKGTRVRVHFDAADPTRPYAAVWDEGAVTEVTLANGTLKNARQGDMVFVTLTLENLTYLATLLNGNSGAPLAVNPGAEAALEAVPLVVRGVVSSGTSSVRS